MISFDLKTIYVIKEQIIKLWNENEHNVLNYIVNFPQRLQINCKHNKYEYIYFFVNVSLFPPRIVFLKEK